MKFILGKKLEMTQIFSPDGAALPVTAILAVPNIVTQVKSVDTKDGYDAIQVGFGSIKKSIKSQVGHLKGLDVVKTIREFRVAKEDAENLKRGDKITVEVFAVGDEVKVTGTSKGKGFQGVVKRHGFHGAPKSHGHKDQERMPGSIGAGGVQRVFKGRRMAGHMGDEQVTISGLEIVAVEPEKNILYVKGAVPGARDALVMIYGPGKMELSKDKEAKIETPIVETPKTEAIEEIKETAQN